MEVATEKSKMPKAALNGKVIGFHKKRVETSDFQTIPLLTQPKKNQKVAVVTPMVKPKQRKRKLSEDVEDPVELLRRHADIHAETLDVIQTQTETAKQCLAALEECSEVIKAQTESLKEVAESMELMKKALFDVVKHFREEESST